MSNATIIKLGVGVVFLVLGLLLTTSLLSQKETKVEDEDRCPSCGKKYSKNSNRVCYNVVCAMKKKKELEQQQASKPAKTRYVLIGLLTFLIGGTGYLLYREYRGRGPVNEEEVIEFRCPACGRKLGVRMRQSGKRVMCPGCKKMLLLPQLD